MTERGQHVRGVVDDSSIPLFPNPRNEALLARVRLHLEAASGTP
jgi:hypothetical protein